MERILIVKLSAIGDVIHALPVAHAIKDAFPRARLTWIVEPPSYDLLTAHPYIDEVLLFHKKTFKSVGGFLKNIPSFSACLKRGRYDVTLDLQGLGKSAAIAYLSRAPLRLGCCDMREYSDLVSKPVCGPHQNGHIVERYLDVARALGCKAETVDFGIETPPKDADLAERILRQAGMDIASPYAALVVGANWPNKCWPPKYFARLVDWLYAQNTVPVLLGGGDADARIAAEIQSQVAIPAVDLIAKINLRQLAYILRRARVAVGGDTGPMHLAAAVRTPALMLMGPTDANRNGPYGQSENAIEICESCRHCWKRLCALDRDCLAAIPPETVLGRLEQILR